MQELRDTHAFQTHVPESRRGGGGGGRLLNTSTNGGMLILKAGDAYERLAKVNLGEACQATPAVAGGRMFLRTWSHLMALAAEK